ncbi:DUF1722 domain-containing protein [Vagococcus bubulae]|uniref:DUF1722 domain-containing protein n=1 Tax=Vagococcus bubulae TaxID=1977868 RepID=A0A429ZPQ0_9ENTE|nr:DUF1722 domain-containing protein [Vagococcus bubulae]RST95656.1 hypothetical protein CBF36_02955 [Vagococcus bubulae]
MEQVDKQLLKEFQTSWAKHKYWIMSRSQQAYNDIRLLAKGNQWTQEKHTQYKNTLSELATYQPTDKTLTVAYQHIWGYFKKVATIDEKKQYKDLIETTPLNSKELEIFLKELSQKYHQTYLLNMKWDLAPK